MVEAFFVDVEIVACPTVRDGDGLALSSRNRRLDPEARTLAAAWARILAEAPDPDTARRRLEARGIEVDYVIERQGRRFGAAVVGGVRLIDNVEVGEASR